MYPQCTGMYPSAPSCSHNARASTLEYPQGRGKFLGAPCCSHNARGSTGVYPQERLKFLGAPWCSRNTRASTLVSLFGRREFAGAPWCSDKGEGSTPVHPQDRVKFFAVPWCSHKREGSAHLLRGPPTIPICSVLLPCDLGHVGGTFPGRPPRRLPGGYVSFTAFRRWSGPGTCSHCLGTSPGAGQPFVLSFEGVEGLLGPPAEGAEGVFGPLVEGAEGVFGLLAEGQEGLFGPPVEAAEGVLGPPVEGSEGLLGLLGEGAEGLEGPFWQGLEGVFGPPVEGAEGVLGPFAEGLEAPGGLPGEGRKVPAARAVFRGPLTPAGRWTLSVTDLGGVGGVDVVRVGLARLPGSLPGRSGRSWGPSGGRSGRSFGASGGRRRRSWGPFYGRCGRSKGGFYARCRRSKGPFYGRRIRAWRAPRGRSGRSRVLVLSFEPGGPAQCGTEFARMQLWPKGAGSVSVSLRNTWAGGVRGLTCFVYPWALDLPLLAGDPGARGLPETGS